MKQHITIDQLNELTDKQKEKLKGVFPIELGQVVITEMGNKYIWGVHDEKLMAGFMSADMNFIENKVYPLLSIGQMIEFLGIDYIHSIHEYGTLEWKEPDEVCDALWEAVKEVLNDQRR